MARSLVSVQYRNDLLEAIDPQTGALIREFVPETVVGVGNSIGGFYVRGTARNGETRVELVRVSGGERSLPIEKIWSLTRDRKGETVRPGLSLMATTSGSARNGVFHRYNPPRGPLEFALRERGWSPRIEEVGVIDAKQVGRGGDLCRHTTAPGAVWEDFRTDGESRLVEEALRVKSHFNSSHVGCFKTSQKWEIYGGTYVVMRVTHRALGGGNITVVSKVIITPQADLNKVADEVLRA